jgi:hypothetical protein
LGRKTIYNRLTDLDHGRRGPVRFPWKQQEDADPDHRKVNQRFTHQAPELQC